MNDSLKFNVSPTEGLSKAWRAVMSNLGVIVGFTALYFIVSSVVGMIPFIGNLTNLFSFIFSVSLFCAFASIDRSGKATFDDLFSWTPKFAKLLVAHLIFLGIMIVIFLPLILFVLSMIGFEYFSGLSSAGMRFGNIFGGLSVGIILGLIALALVASIIVAIFSFAFMFIVLFRDMSVGDALKLSIRVGRENVLDIIIYAFLGLGVAIIGTLALFIGLLVAIPLLVGTQYYMVRSILPVAEETGNWDFMSSEEASI